MPLIRKSFALEVTECKAADDGGLGTFLGDASVYNVVDLHGDIIEPGAFDHTLRRKGVDRPLLYQHDPHRPIGIGRHQDDPGRALGIEGHPNAEVNDAREAMALVKQGAIKGLSIGFDIIGEVWDGTVRRITEIDLWETSIVTWPANPLANITGKSAQTAYAELKARHTLSSGAAHLKAGRVLSAANMAKVEAALETLGAAQDALQELLDAASAEAEKSGALAPPPAGDTMTTNDDIGSPLDVLLADIRSHRTGSR